MAHRRYLTEGEIQTILDDLPSDTDSTPCESSSASEQEKEDSTAPEFQNNEEMPDSESSDDESPSENQRQWTKSVISTKLPEFTREVGNILQHFDGQETAADIFISVLSKSTLENLLYQTNLYIQQKQKRMKPVDTAEIHAFFGLYFFFGYYQLPHLKHYWSSDIDIGVPIVCKTMQRDRFFDILCHLHVNDNKAIPEGCSDKLYKIRPIIQDLNRNFQSIRLPSQVQSIDESMVLFKGRSSLKQYNPMKPVKRGFKIWCRADMSGYIYEFEVYQGKSQDADNSKERFGLGGSVVDRLTRALKGAGYIVMMDNYFSSVELFEHLKANHIFACGTVRSNRKHLPKLMDDKQMKRGDFDYRSTGQGVVFFKWKDNKCVHLLSNYHGSETTTVSRRRQDGTTINVAAPKIVEDYNSDMGGVDKADMLRSFYDWDRKSKKWWHRLFFALVDMAYVNAFIIYKDMHPETSLLEFRRSLAMGFIAMGYKLVKKRGRPSIDNMSSLDDPKKRRKKNFSVPRDIRKQNVGAHWPVFVQQRGRCEMCSMRKIQSKPHSKCSFCNVFLCCNEKKNCFQEYHVK